MNGKWWNYCPKAVLNRLSDAFYRLGYASGIHAFILEILVVLECQF